MSIFHGDALDLIKSVEDSSVDFVFTDPPFGHNNNNGKDLIGRIGLFRGKNYQKGSKSNGRPIANDGAEANSLLRTILPELNRVMKPGSCICCCCGGGGSTSRKDAPFEPSYAWWSIWLDEVFDFKQMVIWDKGPMGIGWHYRRSYETVLVAQKRGAACKWYDETNKVENVIRHIRKIIPDETEHPTEKPWQLAAHFMLLHTLPGDVVLDPFAGHGSTAEACYRLGREFVGFELDEGFAKEAVRLDTQRRQQRMLEFA